ncbi:MULTISPECIES: leucine-rich repeat domain-containing protein [unclassified Candidatus Tisiphia]|uniref:leucine-rich repeat domain-containing protein n=1 Tax=unclassified Candidatus Tisiphia TaxID=2996318 RepID=UPI003CCB5127
MTIDFNAYVEGNCLNFKEKGTILPEILSSDDNLNEFSSFIQNSSHITALNLENCNINDMDIGKIELLIKSINNSNITYLDIHGNKITDAGAIAIATMPNLTYLDIHENDITDIGATAIATMPNLTYLDIHKNNNITDIGATVIATMPNLTYLDIHENDITDACVTAIAKVLKDNTSLISFGIRITEPDIDKILERNKEIKDISKAFKPIISKITLDTDGTPLFSSNAEGGEQNSFLKILKNYSEKHGAFPLPVLEQIIAQSLYEGTIYVDQDGIEQLSFIARSKALTEITQTVLEHLGFNTEIVNEFNSKIVEIIEEVKEMLLLELDILNNNLMDPSEINIDTSVINVPTNKFDPDHVLQILLSNEFTRGEWQHNQQLTDLYEKHPDLKIPGTILHNLLNSDSPIYPNIAVLLNQHVDENTFKHNPRIQELLKEFSTPVLTKNLSSALEDNNIEDIVSWLSVINLRSAVKLESNLLTKLSQINNKAVEILLVNQPLKLLIDDEGNNLLHLSLQNGNYQLATQILKEGCINVEQQNNKGKTALDILHESSLTPEQKEAEALLAQHSDSHLPNISEHTSIGLATDDPITPVLGDSSHHID